MDLRAPGHVRLGGGDLVPDARVRAGEIPVHRLVSRSPDRRRSAAISLERGEARRSRARRLETVRSPGAGAGRDRGLGSLSRLRQPAAAVPRTRAGALPAVAPMAGVALAAAR